MTAPLAKAILGQCEEVSRTMKSLSYPARLKILCELMDGEHTAGELTEAAELSQSAASQLLARMKGEGVLECRRDGTRVYYKVADKKLSRLLKAIKDIYCGS